MFDHVSIGVSDLKRAGRFYDAVLKPLDVTRLSDGEGALGYGEKAPGLWILPVKSPVKPDMESGLHFCFEAKSRAAVDAFHAAALKAGGKDNGQPGMYCVALISGSSSAALIASRAYFTRFKPSRNMLIVSIAFGVQTAAGADDACDVGIYDAAGNRIVTSGSTNGRLNVLGARTIPITPTLLTAGVVYYAAFAAGTFGGSAASVGVTQMAGTTQLFGIGFPQVEQGWMGASFPLPSTINTAGGALTACPILAVREI